MTVNLMNKDEISRMRHAGHILSNVIDALQKAVEPGITTADLDALAESGIRRQGGMPAFKGYQGYPASVCASINSEVVHGIPGLRKLKNGDIIGLDLGVEAQGYFADSAVTCAVGNISAEAQRLLDVTRESLFRGIAQAVPGHRIGDLGHAIQTFVEANGFSVVRDLVGHGIGRVLHGDPQVPNYGHAGRGLLLREGMALAIEPMVNAGTPAVRMLSDGWTIVTADASLSAHFEHTIIVSADGPEILTSL